MSAEPKNPNYGTALTHGENLAGDWILVKRSLGEVIEFRLPAYIIYGVCIEEDPKSGDVLAMYSEKFDSPVSSAVDLHDRPIRHKIRFFVSYARSRKFSNVLRVIGNMKEPFRPLMDRRFRGDMSGISARPCWQIIDGRERTVVPFLTEETALLSENGIPNFDYLQDYYDNDYYPWSASRLMRGPLNFDADTFERKMRANFILDLMKSNVASTNNQ